MHNALKRQTLDKLAKSPTGACGAPARGVFKRQAKVLKALANESRLLIVDCLSRGECSAGELARLVGSDVSTVSKHLALLRAHGIVEDRREGNLLFYRLLTPYITNLYACATQVLKERSI